MPEWRGAECLYSREQVDAALERMADCLNTDLADGETLVLGVLNGAVATLGYLLPRLRFRLRLDHLQVSRYDNGLSGGQLAWLHYPAEPLAGRRVLVVDDILDRGITLAEVVRYCRDSGAGQVLTAVLVRKQLASGAAACVADYWALEVPDRYVFGYGMDCRGYDRNAPGIYALDDVVPGGSGHG